jgi:hypothetical protein
MIVDRSIRLNGRLRLGLEPERLSHLGSRDGIPRGLFKVFPDARGCLGAHRESWWFM